MKAQRLIRASIIALGIGLTLPATTRADFNAGFAAYDLGDFETAAADLKALAERGDTFAQVTLGAMYERGEGVPQDFQVAFKWHLLAAERGDSRAQYNIGFMYVKGLGVPHDYIRAYAWLHIAQAAGSDSAGRRGRAGTPVR